MPVFQRFACLAFVIVCLTASGCGSSNRDGAAEAAGSSKTGEKTGEKATGRGTAPANAGPAKETVEFRAEIIGDIPPLPADVGLHTTNAQLAAQALIVARQEVSDLGAGTVDTRQRAIYAVWLPQMEQKQAYLKQILDERKADSERQIADARRVANNKRQIEEMDAKLKQQVDVEQHKTVPILDEKNIEE